MRRGMAIHNRKQSAGLLLYRYRNSRLEVFLVHPGGPYWAKKDEGNWSIPKGEYFEDEDPLPAATREFREETGCEAEGPFLRLTPKRQAGGKIVSAWAFEGDLDAAAVQSNTFTMEWPPKSGRQAAFPEVDRAGWFPIPLAKKKLLTGQRGFIDELCSILNYDPSGEDEPGGSEGLAQPTS